MKRKFHRRLSLSKWIGVAMVAVGGLTSCSDGYDLADEDPSWLGSSIYDYLQSNGNYSNVVRLVDDMGYKEVLAKTGSKTLFVADDDAYNRFYQNNNWGVHSYNDLSYAQKKLLLFGNMINNSCQVAYLSSTLRENGEELDQSFGYCMRRLTSISLYDSVPVLEPEKMPDNPYWARYREAGKPIVCMSDASTKPMTHFIEEFLNRQLITNDDCDFLFNYKSKRQPADAHVNGVKMAEPNIKCSNGFVHRMEEVIAPTPNMADLISEKPHMSKFATLLNRFCAPYRHDDKDEMTVEYNRLYNTQIDTLYEKRYFSERSRLGTLEQTPDEGPAPALLKFDPAWNQFYSEGVNTEGTNVALQKNMAVMLVPSDAAMERYWNEGAGKVLKDKYGEWENVPDKVISKLLRVNQLNSFINSVPSKFQTVLDDGNEVLGLATEFVDTVYMACNGAVYLTNKVFSPVAYKSVTFPALVNETMQVLYWGVEELGFDVYLNSQNSRYSLFVPTNDALLNYIDPCSYGKPSTQLFRFRYTPWEQERSKWVQATIWNYDTESGMITDSIGEADYNQITNRLKDILDSHIVLGDVEDGNTYYQTKGGSMVKVENVAAGVNGMTVQGGMQLENGQKVRVKQIYDESYEGNGKTYIIEDAPVLTARKSVYDVLEEHEEFSEFLDLLKMTSLLETKHVIGSDEDATASTNISLFNTYRYTVYVPTNDAIVKYRNAGGLPTAEDIDHEEDKEVRDSLINVIETFVKYHIQDNAYFIGQDFGEANTTDGEFETSAYEIEDGNLKYYRLQTEVTQDDITLYDRVEMEKKADERKAVRVTKKPGLFNIMAREYQYDSRDRLTANNLYTSSFAVIHQVDDVLKFK